MSADRGVTPLPHPGLVVAVVAVVGARGLVTGHAPDLLDGVFVAAALLCLAALRASLPAAVALATALWLAAAVVAAAASREPFASLLMAPLGLGAPVFFALGASVTGRLRVATTAALLGVASGHAAQALWQRFVSWPALLADDAARAALPPSTLQRLSGLRPLGATLSPDLGAGLALLGLAAAAALWLSAETPRRGVVRGALGALFGLNALALVVSQSFGAALACGAALALLGAYALRQRGLSTTTMSGAAVLFAAAGALALWVRTPQALLHSAAERWLNWQVALAAFADAPVTGVGLGRFASAYASLRPPGSNITRYAHNAAMQALAEGGLVWLTLFGAGAVVVLRAGWRRRAPLEPATVVWLGAGVAITVRVLLDYDLQVPQTAAMASLAVGLAVGRLLAVDASNAPPAPAWVARAALLGALVTLGVPTLLLARENARADDDERAAWLRRFPADADTALLHAAAAHQAARACADGCEALVTRATERASSLSTSEAPAGARAVAHVLLAEQALWRGDTAEARRQADAALALEPGARDAHRLAVQAARAAGVDEEGARARARRYFKEPVVAGW